MTRRKEDMGSVTLDPESREWRRNRLLRAGMPGELANAIAVDQRFDVHAMLELLDRGCEPVLAARILAPLEEAEERW